jgi:hypothetical protein
MSYSFGPIKTLWKNRSIRAVLSENETANRRLDVLSSKVIANPPTPVSIPYLPSTENLRDGIDVEHVLWYRYQVMEIKL